MDRDEQIGLHAPRFGHALTQRHKKISIAGQESAHVGLCVEFVAQRQRHRQHHIFFAQPLGADGPRVFAAVTGVERDDHQTVDLLLQLA